MNLPACRTQRKGSWKNRWLSLCLGTMKLKWDFISVVFLCLFAFHVSFDISEWQKIFTWIFFCRLFFVLVIKKRVGSVMIEKEKGGNVNYLTEGGTSLYDFCYNFINKYFNCIALFSLTFCAVFKLLRILFYFSKLYFLRFLRVLKFYIWWNPWIQYILQKTRKNKSHKLN